MPVPVAAAVTVYGSIQAAMHITAKKRGAGSVCRAY